MEKQRIVVKANQMEYMADVCEKTNIATIKVFGIAYKFSKHEYEMVKDE